jgi:hypothetical protein
MTCDISTAAAAAAAAASNEAPADIIYLSI